MEKEIYLETPAVLQRQLENDEGKIRTWSGQYVDLFNPDPMTIRMDDIAHSMSLICRYNGHVDKHYSVAQHSLEVVKYLESTETPPVQFLGLLHDASEAYLGDLVSPLKHAKALEHYITLEKVMQGTIEDKYLPDFDDWEGEDWDYVRDAVKKADDNVYRMERISFLFPFEVAEEKMYESYGRGVITPKEPEEVEQEFLFKWRTLSRKVWDGAGKGGFAVPF